ISKSHKITSGRFRRASSTPASPSAASKTFQSARANSLATARRPSSSSSIINTLGITIRRMDSTSLITSFHRFFVGRDRGKHAAKLTNNVDEVRENTAKAADQRL